MKVTRRGRVSGPCAICGAWRRSLHRDHIIAKMNGGLDVESNIQRICANCHEDKTIEDWAAHGPFPPLSEEHRAKIGAAHRGKTLTEEHRALLSKAHFGQPLTEAHREAIRQGHLARVGRSEMPADGAS